LPTAGLVGGALFGSILAFAMGGLFVYLAFVTSKIPENFDTFIVIAIAMFGIGIALFRYTRRRGYHV
jgi:hypothetical protein